MYFEIVFEFGYKGGALLGGNALEGDKDDNEDGQELKDGALQVIILPIGEEPIELNVVVLGERALGVPLEDHLDNGEDIGAGVVQVDLRDQVSNGLVDPVLVEKHAQRRLDFGALVDLFVQKNLEPSL